ncbi:MAG: hypothetical protein QXX09_02330 [Candidatus Methanomethylicia archaeon]
MPKISYGSITGSIILIYFGLIFIMWYFNFPLNFLMVFSGFFLILALWTLTYGFKYAPNDRFWMINGGILLIFSASLFVYSLSGSSILSLGILLLCLGFIGILLVLK